VANFNVGYSLGNRLERNNDEIYLLVESCTLKSFRLRNHREFKDINTLPAPYTVQAGELLHLSDTVFTDLSLYNRFWVSAALYKWSSLATGSVMASTSKAGSVPIFQRGGMSRHKNIRFYYSAFTKCRCSG
jgi:hypothetical protein